jgi:hypothetical protein
MFVSCSVVQLFSWRETANMKRERDCFISRLLLLSAIVNRQSAMIPEFPDLAILKRQT